MGNISPLESRSIHIPSVPREECNDCPDASRHSKVQGLQDFRNRYSHLQPVFQTLEQSNMCHFYTLIPVLFFSLKRRIGHIKQQLILCENIIFIGSKHSVNNLFHFENKKTECFYCCVRPFENSELPPPVLLFSKLYKLFFGYFYPEFLKHTKITNFPGDVLCGAVLVETVKTQVQVCTP